MADIIDEIQVDFDAIADRATRQIFEIAKLRARNARLERELEEARAQLQEIAAACKALLDNIEYDFRCCPIVDRVRVAISEIEGATGGRGES